MLPVANYFHLKSYIALAHGNAFRRNFWWWNQEQGRGERLMITLLQECHWSLALSLWSLVLLSWGKFLLCPTPSVYRPNFGNSRLCFQGFDPSQSSLTLKMTAMCRCSAFFLPSLPAGALIDFALGQYQGADKRVFKSTQMKSMFSLNLT